MDSILQKIKKARQFSVSVGGLNLTVRRPTSLEMAELEGKDVGIAFFLRKFVVDWDAKEIDLIPGGTPEKVAFDPDVFLAWAEDKPEVWPAVIEASMKAFRDHRAAIESELGKPTIG